MCVLHFLSIESQACLVESVWCWSSSAHPSLAVLQAGVISSQVVPALEQKGSC